MSATDGIVQFFLSGDYLAKTEMPRGVYLDETTVWELYAEAARQPHGRVCELVHEQWRSSDLHILNRIKTSKSLGELRADADVEIVRTLMCMAVVTAQMARFADPDFDAGRYRTATRQMLTPFVDPAYQKAHTGPVRKRA